MQLLCMFDLPTLTAENRKHYRVFRKFLMKEGFIMLEESVYTRMIPSGNALRCLEENIRKNKPPRGLVLLLKITEHQYSNMEFIVGEYHSEVVQSTDPVIEL